MNKKLLAVALLSALVVGTAVGQVVRPFLKFQQLSMEEQPTPAPGYMTFWEYQVNSRICTGYSVTSPSGVVTHSPISCLAGTSTPTVQQK